MSKGGARPGAGRPIGTKNRETAIEKVEEYLALEDLPGPLEFLLEVMVGRDPRPSTSQIDLDVSIDAAKTLMRYIYPQVRSTEITMGLTSGGIPQLVVSGEEMASLKAGLAEKLTLMGVDIPARSSVEEQEPLNIIQ